jgi:hypothetical protein
MKKLALLCLALLAVVTIALPATSTAADLKSEAQCQAGDNSQCIGATPDPAATATCGPNDCDIIAKYLNPAINALAILGGFAIVTGIMIGGIQYASSGGDPQKSAGAKKHLRVAIISLLAFFFLWSMLQFLIPGTGLLGV